MFSFMVSEVWYMVLGSWILAPMMRKNIMEVGACSKGRSHGEQEEEREGNRDQVW